MNISEVKVKLTKEDLLDLLREVIDLKGLIINSIELDNKIGIKGTYKKLFNIKFSIFFNIVEVRNQDLVIKLSELKALGIPAIKPIRKLILRKILTDFKKLGIEVENDTVIIHLNELIKDFKFLRLGSLNIVQDKDSLTVNLYNSKIEVKKLMDKSLVEKSEVIGEISEVKEEVKTLEETEEIEEKVEVVSTEVIVEKTKDYYSEGRDYVENKIPERFKSVEDYILLVPDILALIVRLMKDNRINNQTKIAVAASIGYIVVPKDIIFDKIPIVGSIDDMAVVLFALNKLINDVPLEIILENWAGNEKNIIVLKNALEYVKRFTKANNLDKFYSVVEALT
ncbi:YkvA family protein [Clostridium intestinale]|uniref:DUF1232 domain-containing protein n=1 Tax=Clostridium intestinale TaxID=36845 RepID=A0A7D6W2C4_9CLOT|nr:DUF1232 domain-containing protein [Clostridium intestinale]QLY81071.1 DUF1232 domain-containing protein [Clostridium intestinale]